MIAVAPLPLLDFRDALRTHRLELRRARTDILQVNIGKLCNLACTHCHVEAGPKRTEIMTGRTVERVLELLAASPTVHTLDLTGGAPELNPHFRRLVSGARALGRTVIDRCNLTVLFEPGQEDTAAFLARESVQVVASLPCYSKENVDRQRGRGVFDDSVRALRRLNALGYGRGSGLALDLVYNPVGLFLPPAQDSLQARYKLELDELFGIAFDRLLTITNVPISRYLHALLRDGQYAEYMSLLVQSFNPAAAPHVMCRNLVSVSWDGKLHDCDFNQMLDMPLGGRPRTLWDIGSLDTIQGDDIMTARHCFACTAGHGSSCGGSLA